MNDAYLLLTPILMLPIVALFGFVGCHLLFNLEEVPTKLVAPTGLTLVPGNGEVMVSWDAYPNADTYLLEWRELPSTVWEDETIDAPDTSYPHTGLNNHSTYEYRLKAFVGQKDTDYTAIKKTIPGEGVLTSYVTGAVTGLTHNDFEGWAGMGIRVGAEDIVVGELGRIVAPMNSGIHVVKIVDRVTKTDVPNAVAMVDTTTVAVGGFAYAAFDPNDPNVTIPLRANHEYYIVSQEMLNGDNYYNSADTTITTSAVATHEYAVYGDLAGSYVESVANGFTYGPVDFQYYIY